MTVNTVNLENHQPQTPLGLLLAPLVSHGHPPQESHYTILIGWTRPYNKLGIVQKSGQIRIGDRLVEINGISVRNWTFEKIIRVLRCFDDGVRIRSLGFEVLKEQGGIENRTFLWSVARRRLYSLNTSIRSFVVVTVDDGEDVVDDDDGNNNHDDDEGGNEGGEGENHNKTPNKNGENKEKKKTKRQVAKFEIQCDLVIRHYHGNDQVVQYSVWKRFSDFQKWHQSLSEKYSCSTSSSNSKNRNRSHVSSNDGDVRVGGRRNENRKTTTTTMKNDGTVVAFPSKRVLKSIMYGTSNESFLEQRLQELQTYWNSLQSNHPEFFEFGDPESHRYSKETAVFLEIEQYLHPQLSSLHHQQQQHQPQPLQRAISNSNNKKNGSKASLSSPSPSSPPLQLEWEMDTSGISEIPMGTSYGSGSRKLLVDMAQDDEGNNHAMDQSNFSGSFFDGDGGLSASTKQASRSTIMRSDKKKKHKKKITSAKPAFQRKLLEDSL